MPKKIAINKCHKIMTVYSIKYSQNFMENFDHPNVYVFKYICLFFFFFRTDSKGETVVLVVNSLWLHDQEQHIL